VRTFVISLPTGQALATRDVQVTENGQPVVEKSVIPASRASKKTFGVVLLRDTSWSMRGKPLAAATAAEQAFLAHRNPNEQVGEIDFNRTPKTVLPLTTSNATISQDLASPPKIAQGTHIFDAVGRAEALLNAAHVTSGSIVVLSDGADTGSTKTLAQVARSAREAHMRIYTIGFADDTYQPRTLKALAAAGGGEYQQEATAAGLRSFFDGLGRVLSNEYLLQYKSILGFSVPVHVVVSVRGLGTSVFPYRTPATPTNTAPPPAKPSSRSGLSGIVMILIALFAAGVIAFLVIGLLQPRRSGLPARMAEFVSIRGLQRDKGQAPTASTSPATSRGTSPGVSVVAPATPQHRSRWARFQETLEIADIDVKPEVIVGGTIAGTVLAFLLIYVVTGSGLWSLFALGVPYLVREWVNRTLARRRSKFAEQLPDALQVVASALRSGHSFAGALAVVVDSGSEPMKSELQRVVADEQRGVPIQNSLDVVAQRMKSSDVEQLALVAELQREAGGNAAEVVDRVAETVRERFDLKRLIRTLTVQGQMSRWIVSLLPVFLLVVIELENPHYMHPLLHSTGGRIVVGFAAGWAFAGSLVIKRIVEIEV
jgi:tight adherence protein B